MAKYTYAALMIYNAPALPGLAVRNVVYLIVIAIVAAPLASSRRGRSILLLVLGIYTLFFLANLYYNRYFGNYLSYNDVLMGQGVRPFRVLTRHLFRPWDIVFILDSIGLWYLWYRLRDNLGDQWPFRRAWAAVRARRKLLFVIPLLLAGQIAVSNRLLGGPTPGELFETSTAGFAGVYGIVPLYAYEIYQYYSPAPAPAPEPTSHPAAMQPEVVLTDEGTLDSNPNIIMIQVESLDAQIIDFEFDGQEVTPFLNDLKGDSLYGSDFYAQHVNGSFDAEFAALTSLYPPNKNYAFKNNDMSAFDSLVGVLNDNGYQTMAFHANDAEFFHRHKAFPELGFERFYSREDFDEEATSYEVGRTSFGINDYDFFSQAIEYIESASEPFFAFLITVTSHTVFDFYPESFAQETFQDASPTILRDYLTSAAFVDYSLEMFFSALEHRDLHRNTLIVLYADHDAAIETPLYNSRRNFVPERPLREHPEHVPLFIKHEDIAPRTISKTGTAVDIAPTILDLVGADPVPEEFVGSSLLHPTEEPVLFLHEVPQVLYKDHLFALELAGENGDYEVVEVGHLPEPREEHVEMSHEQEEELLAIIQFTREIIANRRP
ncbi:MAG: LTA synthase family protein [Alkalispirochaeta sp.]